MNVFVESECTRDNVPGGWADQLWSAADRGEWGPHEPQEQLANYLGPSLDTTIHSTSRTPVTT
jgi:hypothetical protein